MSNSSLNIIILLTELGCFKELKYFRHFKKLKANMRKEIAKKNLRFAHEGLKRYYHKAAASSKMNPNSAFN